jgi:hypothetical protein
MLVVGQPSTVVVLYRICSSPSPISPISIGTAGADSESSRAPRPTTPVRPAPPCSPGEPTVPVSPSGLDATRCTDAASMRADLGGDTDRIQGRRQQDSGAAQRGSPAPPPLPSVMSPSGEASRIQVAAEGARQQRARTYRLCHCVGGRNVFFSFDMWVLHVIGMKGILELYQTFFRI